MIFNEYVLVVGSARCFNSTVRASNLAANKMKARALCFSACLIGLAALVGADRACADFIINGSNNNSFKNGAVLNDDQIINLAKDDWLSLVDQRLNTTATLRGPYEGKIKEFHSSDCSVVSRIMGNCREVPLEWRPAIGGSRGLSIEK